MSRIRAGQLVLSLLLFSGGFSFPAPASAQQPACGDLRPLDHAYASGASWSMCLSVNAAHGLGLHALHYRAPGDTRRSILAEAHLGQILLHYHDSTVAHAQVKPADTGPAVITDAAVDEHPDAPADATGDAVVKPTVAGDLLAFSEATCDGTRLSVSGHEESVCTRVTESRLLARYASRPALHTSSLVISSTLQRGTLNWTTRFTLGEDGSIRPGLILSGRAARTSLDPDVAQILAVESDPLVRATVLVNWRLVFDVDAPGNDRAEQFDFVLDSDDVNRRAMQISQLTQESWLQVDREAFRGWRIRDASGAGYYLDPANSGFHYVNADLHWAEFDAAISRFNDCERHAMHNTYSPPSRSDAIGDTGCGSTLTQFIDGESLSDAPIVLWYNLSRTLSPAIEDWPVLRDRILEFELLPFDWTPASPFESQTP